MKQANICLTTFYISGKFEIELYFQNNLQSDSAKVIKLNPGNSFFFRNLSQTNTAVTGSVQFVFGENMSERVLVSLKAVFHLMQFNLI